MTPAAVAAELERLAQPFGGVVVYEGDTVVELHLRFIPVERRPERHPSADVGVFDQLRVLDLSESPVRSVELSAIAGLRELKELDLTDTTFVDDQAISHIAKCPKLESISFTGTRVTGAKLHLLADLKHLRTLRLDHGALNSKGVRALGALKQLKSLSLQGHQLVDEDLEPITTLTGLEELDLWGQEQLSTSALQKLKKLESLRVLNLTSTEVTDGIVETLAEMKSLDSVQLRVTQVTHEGIARLKKLAPHLTIDWTPRRSATSQ